MYSHICIKEENSVGKLCDLQKRQQAGEMTQQLRVLAPLEEDLALTGSQHHMVANNNL